MYHYTLFMWYWGQAQSLMLGKPSTTELYPSPELITSRWGLARQCDLGEEVGAVRKTRASVLRGTARTSCLTRTTPCSCLLFFQLEVRDLTGGLGGLVHCPSHKDREVTRAGYQWHAWGLVYRVSCLTAREALRSWRALKVMHRGQIRTRSRSPTSSSLVVSGRKGRKLFFLSL